ncbi:MAG: hypothetical protein ABIV39_11910 [Verrucomicrobiota bacterium]
MRNSLLILPTECRQHVKEQFNELALSLFALQFCAVKPYRKFCEARKISPQTIQHWGEIPALPTSAFKEFKISGLKPEELTQVFHSSGTTGQIPSRHFHNSDSLSLYEASLLPWFQKHLLADWDEGWGSDFKSKNSVEETPALTLTLSPEEREHRLAVSDFSTDSVSDSAADLSVGRKNILPLPGGEGWGEGERFSSLDKPGMIFLTPPPALAPNSSLVHMFETVRRELGSRDSLFTGKLDEQKAWALDIEQTLFALRKSMCANLPIALLGTAFSFVHLLDHFAANNIRYRLAEGSRVLETGGYKGRSRSLPKAELHDLITKHLGIPASHIVCEYGMSELSSQAYDQSVERLGSSVESSRAFRFPPWARVQVISPETGKEVCEGETGLVRIFDLANVYSVLAVHTEDLGIRRSDGFELIGRSPTVEPRGCSLMPP